MNADWSNALCGGVVIGLAAGAFLLTYGRVLGVSGIASGVLNLRKGETLWRMLFLLGVVCGGAVSSRVWPENFSLLMASTDYVRLGVSGLIVGFGTKMGSGCTSGHGICGIGRLSVRGIIATLTFMLFAVLTVPVLGRWGAQ